MSMSTTSRSYSIVEPHPSVTNNMHYISTGRGGFGNAVRSSPWGGNDVGAGATRASVSASTSSRLGSQSSSSSTTPSSASSSRKTFTTGRGGAGNVFPSSERAIFSFDEELEQQLRWERDAAPVYHVGRGGAGNVGHVNSNATNPPPTMAYPGAGSTSAMMMRRRPSEDSALSATSASSHGSSSESGADQFNRSVKKGWKKIASMGMHHHHHNIQH